MIKPVKSAVRYEKRNVIIRFILLLVMISVFAACSTTLGHKHSAEYAGRIRY